MALLYIVLILVFGLRLTSIMMFQWDFFIGVLYILVCVY